MRRKPRKLPDYFTEEEAADLVAADPDYKTRMAMKIMVRTGLRVSDGGVAEGRFGLWWSWLQHYPLFRYATWSILRQFGLVLGGQT